MTEAPRGVAMQTEERVSRALDRGRTLAERVREVAAGVWLVPSQRVEGTEHEVVLERNRLRCDCQKWGFRTCAHTAAVALVLMGAVVVRVPAPTARQEVAAL